MNNVNRILTLLTGGLLAFNTFAAEAGSPLHVLYLGPVSMDGGARGFGGGCAEPFYLRGRP
jgi:hypothetical protein